MNSSIFIGSFSSFVVGFRPSHRSRDTRDGSGSAPRDTRSRPAVINARSPGPTRPAHRRGRGRPREEIESKSSGRMNSLPYHRRAAAGAPAANRRLVDLSAASSADNIVTAAAAAAAAVKSADC